LLSFIAKETSFSMNITHNYTEDEIIVAKSRNGVTLVNRGIAFLDIAMVIFGIFKWGWLSVPLIILGGWLISIVNSILVSNKVKRLTGLGHEEQAVIWDKMISDYEKSKSQSS